MHPSLSSLYHRLAFKPRLLRKPYSYFGFPLILRIVEDMLAYRVGLAIQMTALEWAWSSTVYANNIPRRTPLLVNTWNPDEVVITINSEHHFL